MKNFPKISVITGWVVFAIALLTYMLTLEPTASLWDCPEFIATSYKLEVGHPPGTPLFFLINRFGAMFAGDAANVAYAVNTLSAIESALTIAFMFWSIVMLGRMLYKRSAKTLTESQEWAAIAAGFIGSLAYAWTDTFWFSAVEAEVYALSSLFTAVVFWAILKWETLADQPGANRWLVLIAYLMGLSIGAHILNLLAIPALTFVYYFKKFPKHKKSDLWKPGAVSIVLTGAFYLMTPTVVGIGAWVDRIFVNNFSLPVNSGLATTIVVLLAALVYGVWWSHKNVRVTLNTIFLSAIMVVIGFSSYGIVLIRSSVNPPMNSNHPANPYALKSFLNRDQYGAPPLFYGPTYASTPIDVKMSTQWSLGADGKYVETEKIDDYVYDPATLMFFPRVYDGISQNAPRYIPEYKSWGDIKGRQVRGARGDMVTIPTFGENLKYFFGYQLNHMYIRYFLWNFVGRQSDIQSSGNIDNGQWMSGIKPIDEIYLGPQSDLPNEIATNKGRNTYFFLPLILGLIGLFFQLKRDGRGAFIVFILFFMTGLAIILYLNQTPLQPRERDYAYAGSFYAFAIWIGLGVLGVYDWVSKKLNAKTALIVATVATATVPTVLVAQNWDDHDRSGRTIARDMGFNYLNSTLPNSILINYGDNDAFPVWYAQEVEGLRTDVRPMNFSYITGDWYIDQMRIKSNESDPVPFSIPAKKYGAGSDKQFPIQEIAHPEGRTWTAKEVMAVINSDDQATKLFRQNGGSVDFVPARRIAVPVNKKNALEAGILTPETVDLAEDTIYIEFDKNKTNLYIDEVLFIDLLANFDWKRPLYFTSYGDMVKYGVVNLRNNSDPYSFLQNEGVVHMLTPIKSPISDMYSIGRVDSESLYDNLMNKYSYGNMKDSTVYADTFVHNTINVSRIRSAFAQLANTLAAEGDTVRAVEVLDRAMVELPTSQIRFDDEVLPLIEAYWNAGEFAKGDALAKAYAQNEAEYVDYYERFTGRKRELLENVAMGHLRNLYMLLVSAQERGRKELVDLYGSYVMQPNS